MANSFGTSVGAKVLTLRQACIVAAVFDVGGALSLGARVTSTIAGKIVEIGEFEDTPAIYMVGLLCASLSTAICVGLASRLALPVSTSHAVVSAIGGFSLVYKKISRKKKEEEREMSVASLVLVVLVLVCCCKL